MIKVLLVDDVALFRDIVCACLRLEGFEVRTATDGVEALRVLESYRPHVILADIAMPGMDGLQLARALREHPKHRSIPVIAVSAVAGREVVGEALALGVKDFLLKSSFSTRDLCRVVREHACTASAATPGPALATA